MAEKHFMDVLALDMAKNKFKARNYCHKWCKRGAFKQLSYTHMSELFIPNIIAYPNSYNHLLHHNFHDKMPR